MIVEHQWLPLHWSYGWGGPIWYISDPWAFVWSWLGWGTKGSRLPGLKWVPLLLVMSHRLGILNYRNFSRIFLVIDLLNTFRLLLLLRRIELIKSWDLLIVCCIRHHPRQRIGSNRLLISLLMLLTSDFSFKLLVFDLEFSDQFVLFLIMLLTQKLRNHAATQFTFSFIYRLVVVGVDLGDRRPVLTIF